MSDLLQRLQRFIDGLNERVGRAVFWLLVVMVLVGTFNAVARYAGRGLGVDLSSNAYLELQWYLFSLVFLLGGAYTLKHDAHVRVDVLYDRLSSRSRLRINLVGHLVFLVPFCLLMIVVSFKPVVNSITVLERSPDPGGLWPFILKPVVPLAFALLLLQGVAEILRLMAAIRGESGEAGESSSEEEAHL